MITNRLEKNVILYKNQFEKLILDIYQEHRMERLSIDLDAILFRIRYMIKHDPDQNKMNLLKEEFVQKALELRNIFGEVMYNLLVHIIGFQDKFSKDDIVDILSEDVTMDGVNVTFKLIVLSDNLKYLEFIDKIIKDDKPFNLFPGEFFRYYVDSYNDGIAKAYPELFENKFQDKIGVGDDHEVFCHSFTFQTSEYCSLNCVYCVPGDTKILMSDFKEKDIKDIKIGEEVLGFEESVDPRKQRTLLRSKVIKTFKRTSDDLYKIVDKNSGKYLYITGEHPILTHRGWKLTKDVYKSKLAVYMVPDIADDNISIDIEDINYITGYFLGAFMGDGLYIKYDAKDGYRRYILRFIVKDREMNDRMSHYADILGFTFHKYDFEISKKYNIILPALLSRKKSDYDLIMKLIDDNLAHGNMNKDKNFLIGYLAGIYDAEGSFDGCSIRITNTNLYIMYIIEQALKVLSFQWKYDVLGLTKNSVKSTIRIIGGISENARFFRLIHSAISRKKFERFIGKSIFFRNFDINIEKISGNYEVYNIETETHTYIANSFLVHNCYQFNKTKTKMTFNTAKKFIDELLADHYGYLNRYNSPAIILEFIGGEPLLEINLTRKIYEYFLEQTYKLDHPWFKLHRVSICSNGLSYFDKEVQDFFKEYAQNISFNISIDGAKDLHDACRIQPNGEGSYDVDMIALNHYNKHHTPERNSKMTIAPGNLKYLFDSVVHFIQNGMKTINLNCVFEEGWNETTAKEEYYQLKKLADYIVENNLEHIYLSIFSEKQESINAISFDGNECGGTGAMLSLRPNGQFYPCIRYMPSSVGSNVEDLCIGTIDKGIIGRTQNSEILKKLDNITRRSKTNDICFECPIASNCAGCSALGHTVYGTANKKTTFHCIQHIAETLANVYFWNRLLLAHPDYDLDVRKNNVPPSWAKIILDDDELEELRLIELAAIATKLEYSEGGEYGNE